MLEGQTKQLEGHVFTVLCSELKAVTDIHLFHKAQNWDSPTNNLTLSLLKN
jgi:hypothetical protein